MPTSPGVGRVRAAAQWRALGTQARIVVTDPDALDEARAIAEADLDAIDETCSRFREDSELRSLDDADGATRRVSPLLAEAITVALRAARLTDGDVDPTIGAAMIAAGYDRDFGLIDRQGATPSVQAVRRISWQDVVLDSTTRRLTMPEGTRLDLGATAKAWAADVIAADIVRELGCGVLVSLGGDVAVAGPAPVGGWTVRVQDITGEVDAAPGGPSATVSITSGGLASSGTSARRWSTRDGRPMHHIIDPRTSLPAVTPWRTVSVVAASCLDANIAATASITRGKAALPWLRRLGLPTRFVRVDGVVMTVSGWPDVERTEAAS